MQNTKEIVFATRNTAVSIFDKIICMFLTLSLEKSADKKMIKSTRVPVDVDGNEVALDSEAFVKWAVTKESRKIPNPYYGKGIRVISILKNASPAGADYEKACNNLRLRLGKEADFEAQAHNWFAYDPNSRVLGHNKKHSEAIEAGDMEHASTHIALPMTTWAPSVWIDAMGNVIDAPHEARYLSDYGKKQAEDKVPYNNVKVDNIIEINCDKVQYVIVESASRARELQADYDKKRQADGEEV